MNTLPLEAWGWIALGGGVSMVLAGLSLALVYVIDRATKPRC